MDPIILKWHWCLGKHYYSEAWYKVKDNEIDILLRSIFEIPVTTTKCMLYLEYGDFILWPAGLCFSGTS